jgi:hypothetical protein
MVLVAIGLVLVGVALALKAQALRQRFWRKVQGTVISAEVKLVRENYGPVVQYEYSVDGRSFRGTRIYSLSVTSSLRSSAQRVISQYPIGASVEVYVDPTFPTEAVLKPGGDPSFLFLMLAFALLPMITGVAMLAIS